jgi:hypothetical protein
MGDDPVIRIEFVGGPYDGQTYSSDSMHPGEIDSAERYRHIVARGKDTSIAMIKKQGPDRVWIYHMYDFVERIENEAGICVRLNYTGHHVTERRG